MFERASRLKLRFETSFGRLAAEDLWDLPLPDLDAVAIALHHKLKNDNVSFINQEKPNETMQLRFDVARHIIDVRLDEQQQAKDARAKSEKKQQILSILSRKENAKLEEASEDELRGLLADL